MKRGDRVLQLGLGSGFKACTIQWKALRSIHTQHPAWGPDVPRDPKLPSGVCEAPEADMKVLQPQPLNIEAKGEV